MWQLSLNVSTVGRLSPTYPESYRSPDLGHWRSCGSAQRFLEQTNVVYGLYVVVFLPYFFFFLKIFDNFLFFIFFFAHSFLVFDFWSPHFFSFIVFFCLTDFFTKYTEKEFFWISLDLASDTFLSVYLFVFSQLKKMSITHDK